MYLERVDCQDVILVVLQHQLPLDLLVDLQDLLECVGILINILRNEVLRIEVLQVLLLLILRLTLLHLLHHEHLNVLSIHLQELIDLVITYKDVRQLEPFPKIYHQVIVLGCEIEIVMALDTHIVLDHFLDLMLLLHEETLHIHERDLVLALHGFLFKLLEDVQHGLIHNRIGLHELLT